MAWIDQRSATTPNAYRYISFVGARILEYSELDGLQDLATLKSDNSLQAMFKEGATVNAKVNITGGNTLSVVSSDGVNPALAFFNGAFETLPAYSQTVTPGADGTYSYIYLHWVLWRVSSDGSHNGISGCLTDPTLVDATSGEPTAERGQLQLVLSTDASLSSESLNTTTMVAKSTSPVTLFTLRWLGGAAQVTPTDPINEGMLANDTRGGFVKLSTGTSNGVAAASDDGRLSDQRTPRDNSVTNAKVAAPTQVQNNGANQTASLGTWIFNVVSGGIGSLKLIWEYANVTLYDALVFLYSSALTAASQIAGHETRITTLEAKKPPVLDLSWHVGQNLGIPGAQGTHPPVVKADPVAGSPTEGNPWFQHFGSLRSDKPAYEVLDSASHQLFYIGQDGNFHLTTPFLKLPSGIPTDFVGLLNYISNLSPSTLAGDVSGKPTATIVNKIQNTAVSMTRADGSAAQEGDAMVKSGGQIKFAPVAGGSTVVAGPGITNISGWGSGSVAWLWFTLGNYKLGFGMGSLQAFTRWPFPPGWNSIYDLATASLSVQPNWYQGQVQVLPPTSGNGYVLEINLDADHADTSWWGAVTMFSIAPA